MLVLLGPPFEGSREQYSALAQATGLVAYDLKTRLRPGCWGVVRAIAQQQDAFALVERLRALGLRAVALDPDLGYDPARAVAPLRGLELFDQGLRLRFHERQMDVPYAALSVMVRGEVHLGGRAAPRTNNPSSSSFRAAVPASDLSVFRESATPAEFDAFAAADLHFFTVLWFARIDARSFDFSALPEPSGSPAENLDRLLSLIEQRSGARVDRNHRTSSVASFSEPRGLQRPKSGPLTLSSGKPQTDERFDAYSRIVAEAERLSADLPSAPG